MSISPKPRIDPSVLDSEAADVAHDIAIEARGDQLALQVGRLCRYFDRRGMPGLDCPPPTPGESAAQAAHRRAVSGSAP